MIDPQQARLRQAAREARTATVREVYRRLRWPLHYCQRLVAAADFDVERAMKLHEAGPPDLKPLEFACPQCGHELTLSNHSDCARCSWLRFPGDRSRWGAAGRCPDCGFSHRWDGEHCSHCGYGTTEVGRAAAS